MRRHGPRQICVFAFLVAALVLSSSAGPRISESPLRVKLIMVGQENCRGDRSTADCGTCSVAAVIHLKLRLEITNLSNRRLIVAKGIGTAWYGIILAKNKQALAAGIYESHINPEWNRTESNLQSPPDDAPSEEFAILAPGESFDVESIVDLAVQQIAERPVKGLLHPGNHVLQLDMGTWPHVTRPERFRESWKKYGEVVYQPVKSEPLSFRVPPEPDFTKCGL
jgi:hypothetical protein